MPDNSALGLAASTSCRVSAEAKEESLPQPQHPMSIQPLMPLWHLSHTSDIPTMLRLVLLSHERKHHSLSQYDT